MYLTVRKSAKQAVFIVMMFITVIAGRERFGNGTVLETKFDRHIVKESNLIFQGVVEQVQYKNSRAPVGKKVGVPHTFVTFGVERIFKGDIRSGNIMTLRFEGGVADDGKLFVVDGVPLFDKGERYILFIKGNTANPCPLVGWNQGLFRVINGSDIYSEGGNRILLADRLETISLFVKSDVLDPDGFIIRMVEPKTEMDNFLLTQFQKDTLSVLHKPEFRQNPFKNMVLNLIIRDLNHLITLRGIFTEEVVNSLLLRDETRDNWKLNGNHPDPFYIARVNRQILEDAYPAELIKTPNQILAWGAYTALDEVLVHDFTPEKEGRVRQKVVEEFEKGQSPSYVEGKAMNLMDVTLHLGHLVQLLHTPDELKALPEVPSADIRQEFDMLNFTPAPPPKDVAGTWD